MWIGLRIFRQFVAECRGNLSVTFAVAAFPVVAIAGLVSDYTHTHGAWVDLQDAADSAALAGVVQGGSNSLRISMAESVFQANLQAIGYPATVAPSITINQNNQVTVTAAASIPTYLLGVVGQPYWDIDVVSVAQRMEGPEVCLLALNQSATKGFQITGNSSAINAIGCAVHSNAAGDQSMFNVSNTASTADKFCARGGIHGDNFSPAPVGGCGIVDDPFAEMTMPVSTGCDHTRLKITNGSHTLSPGIYCDGISITGGSVTFEEGFYFLDGGSFKIAGGGDVSGAGVTFYLTGEDAELDFSAEITAELSAPTSGDYAGFLFIQNPASSAGATSKITGGADVDMRGIFYFPTQGLKMSGTGSLFAESHYAMFIADTFELKGNGTLTLKLDEDAAEYPGIDAALSESGARLVN